MQQWIEIKDSALPGIRIASYVRVQWTQKTRPQFPHFSGLKLNPQETNFDFAEPKDFTQPDTRSSRQISWQAALCDIVCMPNMNLKDFAAAADTR